MAPLSSIALVLVEPRGSLNIGSAARAMANSGLTDLRIVRGARHLNQAARQMAMSGTPILEAAQVFDTVEAAVADRHLVIGSSRRRGKGRGRFVEPEELVARLLGLPVDRRAAVLFGSEDTGLSTADLEKCHYCVELPAAPGSGSYNLAHSVLLVAHHLFLGARAGRAAPGSPPTPGTPPANREQFEGLYAHLLQTLRRIRFFRRGKSEDRMRDFRLIFERAQLDTREVRIFRGLMSQINYVLDRLEAGKGIPEDE